MRKSSGTPCKCNLESLEESAAKPDRKLCEMPDVFPIEVE